MAQVKSDGATFTASDGAVFSLPKGLVSKVFGEDIIAVAIDSPVTIRHEGRYVAVSVRALVEFVAEAYARGRRVQAEVHREHLVERLGMPG